MAILTESHASTVIAMAVALSVFACNKSESTAAASRAQRNAPPVPAQDLAPVAPEQRTEPRVAEPPARQGMRFIPKTTFFFGLEPGPDDVEPGHETQAGPFYIDEIEVTVEQYRMCLESQRCQAPSENGRGCNLRKPGRDHHPMNCIDWYSADRFCRAQSKRLPNAEEWQLAARGTDRRIYPWGKVAPSLQLCCRSRPNAKSAGTCEVGSHSQGESPFGIHDMAGNVAEWTASKAPVAAGSAYEVYGGGYLVDDMETPEGRDVRLDQPTSYAPAYAAPDVGFRCVADAS